MATPNRSERGGRGKTKKPPVIQKGTASRRGAARSTRPQPKPSLNNPKNGDTTIKEGHKFVFKNGKWVKASNAKPAAKPTAKPKVADYTDAQGNVYDGNKGSLKKPASKPAAKPAASKPAAKTTAKPAAKTTAAKPAARNVGPVASGNEYARNKDPKKYNPLMQKTFGYQKGDAPDQLAKKAASEKPDVGYKTSTKVAKNYADKKPSNTTSNAYDKGVNLNPAKPSSPNKKKKKSASQNLAEAIRKRRTHT